MEDIIQRALNFAEKAHQNQKRKFTGEKYISHPINVAEFIAITKMSRQKDLLIAVAILHDVIEDTDYNYDDIKKLFGYKVADLVLELTNDKKLVSMQGKAEYLLNKMIGMTPYALCIKLADILSNMIGLNDTAPTFKKKFLKRVSYIIKELPTYRFLTDTHLRIIHMINIKLKELSDACC